MLNFWHLNVTILNIVLFIIIFYPIIGGIGWSVGVLCYKYIFKHQQLDWIKLPSEIEPMISIMIPAHNEEVTIKKTVDYLINKLNYSNFEVIVIDDGSNDQTLKILKNLQNQYSNLKVIRIEDNKGKAHALNIGLAFAKGELILSNDADSIPETDALKKYVNYFIRSDAANIAAVTGNIDIHNRDKLVAKSQLVEFSSIVGTIKRTELGVFGGIYAYSGASTMYRKDALIDVGLFRQDRATEDISAAWDHQLNGWISIFAPDITFYTAVPETAKSLYQQRKRWAKGGTEVWLTNFKSVFLHPFKNFGLTLMFIDQTLSIIWSFLFWILTFFLLIITAKMIITQKFASLVHLLTTALVFICFEMIAGILQLLTSLVIDNNRQKFRYLLFAPLYMLIWWIMNALTIVVTFIPAIQTILGYGSGTWISPKRN